RAPFGWPESYPDWDFMLRLFLNHRGHFVDGVLAYFHYDANHAYARGCVDNYYELFTEVNLHLMPLIILIDPELAAIRQQIRPDEILGVLQTLPERVGHLMNLSDEVVAFDSPHFTAKVMSRLQIYSEGYRGNPQHYSFNKRLRQ